MSYPQENQYAVAGWNKGPSKPKTQAEMQRAKAAGQVVTEKKFGNANSASGPANARKLDEEDGDFRHQKIDTNFKKSSHAGTAGKRLEPETTRPADRASTGCCAAVRSWESNSQWCHYPKVEPRPRSDSSEDPQGQKS
mmetsp:Transcript_18919/g.26540  ORF Transcript_18919/g.26540 Transcript_18919/m.26540 type:complete len:138 (-) Transcript_18919:193-606(-)